MPSASELCRLTLTEAAALVADKAVSPVELTQACLERIERLDPALNAFITVTRDIALEQARIAEREIASGRYRGPLHGIPVALKDLIDTAGARTTAASALFQERVPAEDAAVVRRLKVEGAVLLGKTNLHEFAYGGSGVVSYYGAARNPWARAHITGGSSSGSAAAVAAGMCFAALGSDTAGSHSPARRVLRDRRNEADLRAGERARRGSAVVVVRPRGSDDTQRARCGARPAGHRRLRCLLTAPAASCRKAITAKGWNRTRTCCASGSCGSFSSMTWNRRSRPPSTTRSRCLETLTSGLSDASMPIDTDRTVQAAEAYAYHAQFLAERAGLYQPETLRRIQRGESVAAREYILKRIELDHLRRAAADLFADYDLLVTPTSPVTAPALAELQANPDDLRRRELILLRNTRPFNVLGLPAVSVPCGFTRAGLPIGLQIAGAPGDDARVLQLAHAYERATEWHKQDLRFVIGDL